MSGDVFAQLHRVATEGLRVQPAQYRERGDLKKAADAEGVALSTMWGRWNAHKVDRAKKARQAKEWREQVMRPEWRAYCEAHVQKWPELVPVGFGRWISEKWYRRWRDDPAAVLQEPNTRSLFASREAWERAGRIAGYER